MTTEHVGSSVINLVDSHEPMLLQPSVSRMLAGRSSQGQTIMAAENQLRSIGGMVVACHKPIDRHQWCMRARKSSLLGFWEMSSMHRAS